MQSGRHSFLPYVVAQSVMNAAAQLVYLSSRHKLITPLLRQLHWLTAP